MYKVVPESYFWVAALTRTGVGFQVKSRSAPESYFWAASLVRTREWFQVNSRTAPESYFWAASLVRTRECSNASRELKGPCVREF